MWNGQNHNEVGTEGVAATVVNRFHSGKMGDFSCSTFLLSVSARNLAGVEYSVSLYNQHRLGFTFTRYLCSGFPLTENQQVLSLA